MRILRTLFARLFALLFVWLALLSLLLGPAAALVVPPSYAPRQFPTQQVHYYRYHLTVNNSCTLPASAGSCQFRLPWVLPYNAFILRVTIDVITAFNSTTTDTLSIGVTSGGSEIVAGAGCSTHATGGVGCTVVAATGIGTKSVGAGVTQTGPNGGMQLFGQLTYTGASPASAGDVTIVLEYIAPNDADCQPVPMAATAGNC